ncbi:MAG TPA: HEAT repeat domain-containing protein, partial [Pirellulales bacterium]
RNEQAATASLETAWHIKAMGHPSASVRLATVMGLDPRFHASDEKYGKALESLLKDDAAEIQREAAVALGRAGRTSAVPALLARMETPLDRSLEHAVIFSLIELDSPETTVAGLASSNSSVQRAALIALDQMKSGTLEKEEVAPLLASRDAALAETALEVVARRPAWSGELETLVVQAFARPHHAEADRNLVRGAVVALANRPVVENLLAETVGGREPTFEQRLLALDAMSRMRPTKVPLSWPPALAKALAVQDDAAGDSLARETIAVAATLGIESIDAELIALSRDGNAAEDLRAAALIVAASHHRELAANDFELLAARLHPDQAPPDRLAAARGLGLAKLTSEQRRLMASLIETAGPLEVGNLLAAFEGDVSFDRSTAEALARALQGSPGLGSLSATRIENLSLRVPEESQPMFAALVAKLDRGQAEARERLDQLAKDIAGGDVERGRAVFTGKRAACSSCHRATNQGGLVGPDLSTIGQRRSERDLLEAVLYPSLSLARGFESFSIETHDGRSRVGVVVRETPQTLTLRLIDQSDVELARSDIADMSPSPLSVMPAGLEKTMNPTELRDLIAYLKSLK